MCIFGNLAQDISEKQREEVNIFSLDNMLRQNGSDKHVNDVSVIVWKSEISASHLDMCSAGITRLQAQYKA